MTTQNKRIQLTVSLETYQSIRAVARKEHRTVPAHILNLLETLPAYASVTPIATPAALPATPAALPATPAALPATPAALTKPALPPPIQYASDTDKTGWTDAEIDRWNHTETCPVWRPGLALPG